MLQTKKLYKSAIPNIRLKSYTSTLSPYKWLQHQKFAGIPSFERSRFVSKLSKNLSRQEIVQPTQEDSDKPIYLLKIIVPEKEG